VSSVGPGRVDAGLGARLCRTSRPGAAAGAPADRPSYFFDEFNARHFGAWDTELAVHIEDYEHVIGQCRGMLASWAKSVDELISRGKAFR
jgi:hypothetical protein